MGESSAIPEGPGPQEQGEGERVLTGLQRRVSASLHLCLPGPCTHLLSGPESPGVGGRGEVSLRRSGSWP